MIDTEEAKKIYSANKDIEELFKYFKKQGVSQMLVLQFRVNELGIKVFEADRLVLNSKEWQELRDANISLRQAFFESDDEQGKG